MESIDENKNKLKKRVKCPNCESTEIQYINPNKTKYSYNCNNCGESITIQLPKKSKIPQEEDQKEINQKPKKIKKRKSSVIEEESNDQQKEKEKKKKKKIRRNKSTQDIPGYGIPDKNSDKNDDENEEETKDKTKKKKAKKKHKRDNSLTNLGSLINNIVTNVLGNLHIDGLEGLENIGDELGQLGNLEDLQNGTVIINKNNGPLTITVNRQNISNDVYDPIFSSFGSLFDDVFRNNFSSNFASNFDGDFFEQVSNVVERNRNTQNKKKKPVAEKLVNKLKKFPLTKKYCKKNKNGKFELPSCCICLTEIQKGEETVLLPCGHMFHWKCCLNWLNENNTCPMCRFEIK